MLVIPYDRDQADNAACIRKPQRDGFIEGCTVRLNPAKLVRILLIFVEITLDRMGQTIFDEFSMKPSSGSADVRGWEGSFWCTGDLSTRRLLARSGHR